MIMIFSVWVLYKFDEYSVIFGLTYAFAFQSIADISSGTIFNNDIENDNRDCLLNAKLKNVLRIGLNCSAIKLAIHPGITYL